MLTRLQELEELAAKLLATARKLPPGPNRQRPAIEPRKIPILGADAVQMAEGNTSGRVIASARTTRRGQRPWHVQTLLAREPGDLAIDRSATAVGPHREGEEP